MAGTSVLHGRRMARDRRFSSDREVSCRQRRRWERLQLVEPYVFIPMEIDMPAVRQHGTFCGSPKWLADGKHLVADCMSADGNLGTTAFVSYPDQQSQIFQIDITPARDCYDHRSGSKTRAFCFVIR